MPNRYSWQSLALAAPAVMAYTLLLPILARLVDRRLEAAWPLPAAVSLLAIPLLPLGLALTLRSAWLLTLRGQGTPNPIKPPRRLVVRGPYRWSRNPLMIGAWAFGAGLALALRSPSLLVIYAGIVVIGIVYVRKVEEPQMLKRFGEEYRSYAAKVPRWLFLLFAFFLRTSEVPAQNTPDRGVAEPSAIPAVVAKIEFQPGRRTQWIDAFERYIVPAIREAIEAGDEILDVAYFESIVPGQDYDFLLVFRAKSFGFYDRRRAFPHYEALFRRVGVEEGRRILSEMSEWEASVSVTLLRSYTLGP